MIYDTESPSKETVKSLDDILISKPGSSMTKCDDTTLNICNDTTLNIQLLKESMYFWSTLGKVGLYFTFFNYAHLDNILFSLSFAE